MLHEKYRPRTWADFVGNDKAVKVLTRIAREARTAGKAVWIQGPSGTGKTTLAWLLAGELGAQEIDVHEIDGADCSIERVRTLAETIRYCTASGRAVIVNEAHAMSRAAVQAWLTLLERLPAKNVVVFTTTQGKTEDLFGDFDSPLLSRCVNVPLSSYGLSKLFAQRAKEIAQAEGLDGQPLARYERLAQDTKNNLRRMLGEIEGGRMLEGGAE